MSRLIDQPVSMTSRPSSLANTPEPVMFTWRGARYRVVEIMDTWAEAGRWWEQEPAATAWRVRVSPGGGLMELIMLHTSPPEWRLMRAFD